MRISCLLITAALSAGLAMAQGPGLPLTRIIGVIGIGSGQTARLNVLNPGVGAPLLGMRCEATFNFLDDQGELLKSGGATIDRGKTASLEMTTEAFNGRVQLYGLVLTPPIGQTPNAGYCTLIPTIEIIDNATGNTVIVMSGSSVRPPVPGTDEPYRVDNSYMLDSMRTHRGASSGIGIVNADGPNPDRDMRAWWNAACAACASCPVDSTNKVQHFRAGTHSGALPWSETRGSR